MSCNIAFIGLGAIGYPMVLNIRKKLPQSCTLCVYDVFRSPCEKLVRECGALGLGPVKVVASPREAAEASDVVITMIPDPKEARSVYLDGREGIISSSVSSRRLLLECSTIDSGTALDVAKEIHAAKRGVYVDAPVSGGVLAAEQGTLSFMIGHALPVKDDPVAETISRVLPMMGNPKKLFWCGALGAGLSAKISNNYISCSVLLVVAEAMAIGVGLGVDPKVLQEVIHNSTGQTFMGDNVCPVPGVVSHVPSSNGWKLGFKTQMFTKDLGLGVEATAQVGIKPTMVRAALDVHKEASGNPLCVDRDGSSVYLHLTGATSDPVERSD